jgi:hypothetical protein
MLIKTLFKIPDDVFNPAAEEIATIDWENFNIDSVRGKRPEFKNCLTIPIRGVRGVNLAGNNARSHEENLTITECYNKPKFIAKYHSTFTLAEWISKELGGLVLGKIMIVNLLPHGKIPIHCDSMSPGDYSTVYSRFHIPFKTNEKVLFYGDDSYDFPEHVPYGTLSQLNNMAQHRVENHSEEGRVHVIIDIALPDGNYIF